MLFGVASSVVRVSWPSFLGHTSEAAWETHCTLEGHDVLQEQDCMLTPHVIALIGITSLCCAARGWA